MNARDDTAATTAAPFVGARTMGVLERMRVALEPVTDKLLGPTVSDADAAASGIKSFEREADALISRQRTRGAQKIVRGAALAVAALLVWAALAPVDEVTRGDARVIPSRQLQVVQSLDGGVVVEILVREGQVVEAGPAAASSGRNARQRRRARERGARLRAARARGAAACAGRGLAVRGRPRAAMPTRSAHRSDERRLYEARVNELASTLAVNRQQLAQRQQELTEMQCQARGRAARARSDAAGADADAAAAGQRRGVGGRRPAPGARRGALPRRRRPGHRADRARRRRRSARCSARAQETEIAFRNEARKDLGRNDGQAQRAERGRGGAGRQGRQVAGQVAGARPRAAAARQHRGRRGAAGQGHRRDRAARRHAGARSARRAQGHRLHPPGPGGHREVHAPTTSRSTAASTRRWRTSAPTPWSTNAATRSTWCACAPCRSGFSEKLPIIPGMTAEVDVLTGRKSVMSLPAQAGAEGAAARNERAVSSHESRRNRASRRPVNCTARLSPSATETHLVTGITAAHSSAL